MIIQEHRRRIKIRSNGSQVHKFPSLFDDGVVVVVDGVETGAFGELGAEGVEAEMEATGFDFPGSDADDEEFKWWGGDC